MRNRTYVGDEVAAADEVQRRTALQHQSVCYTVIARMSAAQGTLWSLVGTVRDVGDQRLYDELNAMAQRLDALRKRIKPTLSVELE